MHPLAKTPKINPIDSIPLPKAKVHYLSNGVELYELDMGAQDIIKIEWLFDAGRWYESKPLVARAAAQLLKSGTSTHHADALADFFDFYGAKFKISDDFDEVSIRLYCLSRYLPKLLPVVTELFLNPIYNEEELLQFALRHKQALKLQMQKNEVLAYRIFTEELFGKEHPYGYNSEPSYYDYLNREDLITHHQSCYTASACKVIVAGKIDQNMMSLILAHLEQLPLGNDSFTAPHWKPILNKAVRKHIVPTKNSTQVSIRIGSPTITRKEANYSNFSFTNLLLGGYFGARLMQNLREDKGYTYSIYSSIEHMRHASYFYIYTDVNSSVKDAALAEIYREIERLQVEPVSKMELEMVKNYCLGMLLNMVDGVFNVSTVWKELVNENLPHNFFDQAVVDTTKITAQHVQEMARLYFDRDLLTEVVVG